MEEIFVEIITMSLGNKLTIVYNIQLHLLHNYKGFKYYHQNK